MIKRQVLVLIIVGVLVLLGAFFILFKSQNTPLKDKMLEVEPSVTPIEKETIDEDSSYEKSQESMDYDNSSSDIQDEDVILEEEIIE